MNIQQETLLAKALNKQINRIVDSKLKNLTTIESAVITSINSDGTVNLTIPPDTAIYTNIQNQSIYQDLNVGDYVKIVKQGNRSTNMWIIGAHRQNQSLKTKITDLENKINAIKIYASLTPEDPSTIYGGTWERLKGRFIWAIGDNENPGDTGGEKTHTLTQNELPNISGKLTNFALQDTSTGLYTDGVFSIVSRKEWATYGTGGAYSNSAILKFSAGGGQEHNNMPPYYGLYVWVRVD